ncbi:MAG TPA: hypothetical protein VG387_21110 [Rhizomicrobium sp.]|jgi:hypothetical protein|nr:hypothetical protein [Rhizomicrobium sp.]
MPTFDGGHCFLTTLIPINSADVVPGPGNEKFSHVQLVRNALSVMPTAHQSPATDQQPCNSPFARCTKTHLARLVVLDDVIFNGRMPENSLLVAIKGEDPTVPKPVDTLPTPYLFFIADFDAPQGTTAELRDWLRGVWTKMRGDLDPVFVHCFQYSGKVKDADSFADYMIAHQIDTTMPFNDYWPVGVDLTKALPSLNLLWVAFAAIVSGVVVGWGLSWIFGKLGLIAGGGIWLDLVYWLEILAFSLAGLFVAAYVAYKMVLRAGLKPFPMAPNSDLPSVLKGLHMQREVIGLVPGLQGASDQTVFDEVGKFLARVQVDNLQASTQAPGTIGK